MIINIFCHFHPKALLEEWLDSAERIAQNLFCSKAYESGDINSYIRYTSFAQIPWNMLYIAVVIEVHTNNGSVITELVNLYYYFFFIGIRVNKKKDRVARSR